MNRVIAIFIFQLCVLSGFSQWTRLPGPSGPIKTTNLLECGNQVFLFTDYGIYGKLKGAEKWEFKSPANIKLAAFRNDTIFMVYNRYYLALVDVRKEPFNIQLIEDSYTYYPTAIDCSDSDVFIGSEWEGVKRFFDFSKHCSWQRHNEGLPTSTFEGVTLNPVHSLIVKNDSIYVGMKGSQGIYSARIGEYNWEKSGNYDSSCGYCCRINRIDSWGGDLFFTYRNICIDGSHPSTSSNIYMSHDNGRSAVPFFISDQYDVSWLLKVKDLYYSVIDRKGIMYTDDFGDSWQWLSYPGLDYSVVEFISYDGNDLYCGTASGLYKLKDEIWCPDNSGIEQLKATELLSFDDRLYISTGDSVYINRTSEGSWENITPHDDNLPIFWDRMGILNGRLIISSLPENNYDPIIGWNLYIQQADGSWKLFETPFSSSASYKSRSLFLDGDRIYMFAGELCYSDNEGRDWICVGGLSEPHWMMNIDGKVYCANSHGISRFWPDPEGWQYLANIKDIMKGSGLSPEGTNIDYFCSVGNCLLVLIEHFSPSYLVGWFRSKDGGFTWELVNNGLEEVLSQNTYVHSHVSRESLLVIGMRSGQALCTGDYGDSWKILDYPDFGAGNYGIYGPLAINMDTLYLSVNQGGAEGFPGIWKYPLQDLAVSSKPKEVSDTDLTIFPNPASDRIYIVDNESFKSAGFKVYSVNGSIVMSGEYLSGKGLDIGSLDEGIYFIRISKSKTSGVSKFIIAR